MSNGSTLMNIPPPPPDPVTPSEVPSRSGTPNSTTTSMSELSTVAIKDGHRGHLPHYHGSHGPSGLGSHSSQLEAERADRISRLAGMERVTTVRSPTPIGGNMTPGAAAPPFTSSAAATASTAVYHPPTHSYFDATGNPAIGRERSTVGSASATGSVGAHTTWAGSEGGDMDRMSESQDMDMDTSSVGGMSEEGTASLVAFGEGARTPARQSTVGSPAKGGGTPTGREAKLIDGMTYDRNVVDTTTTSDPRRGIGASPTGTEEAERIVRENMNTTSADRMRGGARPGDLGKFGFEK